MKTVCARLWQAEAVEDGRLVGAERAAFERHAPDCPECNGKLAALARLRQLAGELPVQELNPFERKREREQLLARADAQASGRSPAPRRAWWLAGFGMAAAAAVALFMVFSPALPARLVPVAAPTYQLEPEAGATWHVVTSGPSTRVAVQAGRVAVQVAELAAGQHFVVELPDGEVEVIGTRVIIAADGTTTRTVVVVQGRALLRLEGQSERVLETGESYTAPETAVLSPPPVVVEPSPAPAPVAPAVVQPRVVAPAAPAVVQPRVVVPAPAPPPVVEVAPPPAPAAPTAGEDFAAAMNAFASGDFGRAEGLFAAFAAAHADDSRVEDAVYLRLVCRARRGDAAGARELAREYLRRYPDGFRRREAEGLAAEPAAPTNPR